MGLSDVSLGEYLTTKYALWLDMRLTHDNSLHGMGRKIDGASQSIHIKLRRPQKQLGTLMCIYSKFQMRQLSSTGEDSRCDILSRRCNNTTLKQEEHSAGGHGGIPHKISH